MEIGRSLCDIVLDGDPAPPTLKRLSPQFLANVCCGQTAGWIKMPLGTEVNLGPGDVVLDGVAASPKRGTAPVFGPCLLWPNGWMDEDATWYGSRPRPMPHCVRRRPSFPNRERGTAVPALSAQVYCGHGRPSQLLLSSCYYITAVVHVTVITNTLPITTVLVVLVERSFRAVCVYRFIR